MLSGDATPFVCGEFCHWLCALQMPPGPAHQPQIVAGHRPPKWEQIVKRESPPAPSTRDGCV